MRLFVKKLHVRFPKNKTEKKQQETITTKRRDTP